LLKACSTHINMLRKTATMNNKKNNAGRTVYEVTTISCSMNEQGSVSTGKDKTQKHAKNMQRRDNYRPSYQVEMKA